MLEWPDGFGLSVQFFGIFGLMLLGGYLPPRLKALVVTSLFGVALGQYVLLTPLQSVEGALFTYNQSSIAFLICFLAFVFLSEALVRSVALRPEGGALKLCLGFLGSCLLLANDLSVVVIGLPAFLFLALIGPSVAPRGQKARSGFAAIVWASVLLCILCAGAGLYVEGGGALRFGVQAAESTLKLVPYSQGWSVIFSTLVVLVLFYPVGFLQQDAAESGDWSAAAVFRIAPSVVFAGLLFKWSLIGSTPQAPALMQILVVALSVGLCLVLVFANNILLVVHALALVPMTFLFWALTSEAAIPLALSALFVISVAISRLVFLINFVGVQTNASVSDLHRALRAASFGFRLEFFVLGLSVMPLGTFLGFNFHIKLPFEASICAASLTFAVVMLLGRMLELGKSDEGTEVRLNKAESVIGVITLASLIVLGIYPTPLYNYINYLSHHL